MNLKYLFVAVPTALCILGNWTANAGQTINEAGAMLETLTGIRRSPTQVRLFLAHLGLHRRKVGLLPAKGDPDVQEEYQKKVGATLSRRTSG